MSSDVLGRDVEQRWLADCAEIVSGGQRRTVVIRGEPGIGKTALVEWVADQLTALEFQLFVASAQEIERHRPFGVARRALDTGDARVSDRLLELERGVGGDDRGVRGLVDLPELGFQWVDSLHDVIDQALSTGPVALIFDDAQWADDGSIEAVRAFHDRLHDRQLLILIATRAAPPGSTLDRMLSGVRRDDLLDLGPLDVAGVTELVTDTIGHLPTAADLASVHRAGGNPLFVKTLLASETAAENQQGDLPQSVKRLVSQIVHDLGTDAARLLDMVAVIGTPVSLKTLAIDLDRPLVDVVDTASRVLASELLVDRPDGIAFRHDLVRDVVYDTIAPSIRAALHITVGERMLERAVPAADVATHFLLGAQLGDLEAAGVLRKAATQIDRVAPTVASQLLERTLEILPADHPDREEVTVRLVQTSVFSGQLEVGADMIADAIDQGLPPSLEVELRNARTQIFFLRGEPRRAAADFEVIAELAEGSGREPVILADAAVSAMFAVDLDRARSLAERSIAASDRRAGSHAQPLALGVLSWLTALTGDLEGGLSLATRAVEVADDADGLEGHRRVPHLFHAQCLLWADRTDEAASSLRRGRRLSADLGMGWDEPMYHALAADERLRAGEWDDAVAEVDAGLRRSSEVGSYFANSWLHVHRARVLLWRGQFEQSNAVLDQAMTGLAGAGGQGVDQVWWMRGLLQAISSPNDGLALLRVLWERLDELGITLRQFECAPDIVTVALRAGREEFAESIAGRTDALAVACPSQLASSAVAHCAALLGRDAEAMSATADLYEQRSLPIEALRVRAEASRISQSGHRSVARQLAELGASGLRRWHLDDTDTAENDQPPSGWESLTRSEAAVIELVGRGRSNAEIGAELSISRRTVESHLYHAYPKIQLSTRVELALEAARRFGSAV